ncbi:hypothetical protein PVAND_011762 [Polypedilum vanderplanki]|uniref:OCIA domain-containing protein n=1 Tax=Polypedilum vanderplanki TaxID=319348 RepID=A0A9J6CJM2_POLVA|nr:hypothetical protein PVAND_011762 [Polypedilum vanderplanki]
MNSSNNEFNQQSSPVIIQTQGNTNHHQSGSNSMGYAFSADELRVLKECNIESFYQRSLPIGVGLGVCTYMAIQRGFLKPSANYGATPKVVLSSIVGYFIGKFSYQSKCAEKIMQLPNSRLAEALKRRKGGEFFERINPDGGLSLAPFSSATDIYTDENLKHSSQSDSLNLNLEDRPFNSGLDDTYRPSIDTPDRNFDDDLPKETPKFSITYEELRKRNREEYDRKLHNPYYKPVNESEAPIVRRAAPVSPQQSNDDYQTQTSGPRYNMEMLY